MSGGISLPLPENLEVLAPGTPFPCACRGRSTQAWLRSCQQEVCRRISSARLHPASKGAPAGAGGSSGLVHSTQQTLGSPQWVRTPSTLHSAEAEPKGCSPLRNSSVVMDLTRTRLVWSHHEAQQAGTVHPAQPPAPTASRGDGNSHVKGSTWVRHPAALQGPVLLGHNPSLEQAPGHGKGPSMVRVRVGKLQASFQAGSSQPDPWEGLKGE